MDQLAGVTITRYGWLLPGIMCFTTLGSALHSLRSAAREAGVRHRGAPHFTLPYIFRGSVPGPGVIDENTLHYVAHAALRVEVWVGAECCGAGQDGPGGM
ncbi:hypothetical protein E2C01_047602 [Portunus trituberculatus]|uniref:Uncharacterized protein n=1 Tax=Portunus trituberculatus TaxID=210409 RepID=A0A5B7GAZ2_PORTR|nr:hypothetical protein [Portunus trituberculatus]